MTSNIGARQVKDFGTGVGFETTSIKSQADDIEKNVINNALKKTFAPEFLNRVDDIVIFNSLEKNDIYKIVEIELKALVSRIEKLGYEVSLTTDAKSFICEKGFDKKMVPDHSKEQFKSILKIFLLRKLLIIRLKKVII